MKRLLSVLVAGVLATSAPADNLFVSHVSPWAAYPAGGPAFVHPSFSFVSTPNYYAAYPYVPTFGYQTAASPFYVNRFWPNYAYGFGGFGFGFGGNGYGYGMPANPNVPTCAFGYATGYSSAYSLRFDGATPLAGFVAPVFQNELTTSADPYVERSNNAPSLNGSAKLTMTVPADAIVSIQGERMQQLGTTRTFITPTLFGPTTYDVKVSRKVDGQPSEQTTSVTLQPNQQSAIMVLQ